jgi:antitoxin ParD1/3/4
MIKPLSRNGVADLRRLWREARADKSPGPDPDEVLDELERKYQAMADAASEAGEGADEPTGAGL